MNNQPKILLTINEIPGATIRIVGRVKVPFEITKGDLHWMNHHEVYKGKDKDKVVRKGVRKIPRYAEETCSKGIKLTYDAYEYMTSTEQPEWYYKKDWKRLKPEVRLELHLQRICEANNGKSFTYNILED